MKRMPTPFCSSSTPALVEAFVWVLPPSQPSWIPRAYIPCSFHRMKVSCCPSLTSTSSLIRSPLVLLLAFGSLSPALRIPESTPLLSSASFLMATACSSSNLPQAQALTLKRQRVQRGSSVKMLIHQIWCQMIANYMGINSKRIKRVN